MSKSRLKRKHQQKLRRLYQQELAKSERIAKDSYQVRIEANRQRNKAEDLMAEARDMQAAARSELGFYNPMHPLLGARMDVQYADTLTDDSAALNYRIAAYGTQQLRQDTRTREIMVSFPYKIAGVEDISRVCFALNEEIFERGDYEQHVKRELLDYISQRTIPEIFNKMRLSAQRRR